MNRVNLGSGTWFDLDKAETWEEDTNWNGSNHISVNTGSQWEHEQLYRTAGGAWVLHSWSQWQGSTPRWRQISEDRAHRWLIENDHSSAVPAEVLAAAEI